MKIDGYLIEECWDFYYLNRGEEDTEANKQLREKHEADVNKLKDLQPKFIEAKKEYEKMRCIRDKEKRAAKHKAWYEANKEKILQKQIIH